MCQLLGAFATFMSGGGMCWQGRVLRLPVRQDRFLITVSLCKPLPYATRQGYHTPKALCC